MSETTTDRRCYQDPACIGTARCGLHDVAPDWHSEVPGWTGGAGWVCPDREVQAVISDPPPAPLPPNVKTYPLSVLDGMDDEPAPAYEDDWERENRIAGTAEEIEQLRGDLARASAALSAETAEHVACAEDLRRANASIDALSDRLYIVARSLGANLPVPAERSADDAVLRIEFQVADLQRAHAKLERSRDRWQARARNAEARVAALTQELDGLTLRLGEQVAKQVKRRAKAKPTRARKGRGVAMGAHSAAKTDLERRCTGKRRYSDEASASRVAAQNGWRYRAQMRPYACTDCGGWHLATEAGNPRRTFRDPPKLPGHVITARARDRRRRR